MYTKSEDNPLNELSELDSHRLDLQKIKLKYHYDQRIT